MSRFLVALALIACSSAGAQRVDRAARRLDDGRPGPGYWQQRVDYRIEAALDVGARRLSGREWIVYHNNSPDTLREIHWHLYQNIFRRGSRANREGSVVARTPTLTAGMTIDRIEAGGRAVPQIVNGTVMRTPLAAPLAPGDSLALFVSWSYDVPRSPGLRNGSSGRDFGMAQWYPQIAVYDDQRGWDTTPYLGPGEFYLEYGNWDVRLTLAAEYVVAATGTLVNPDETLDSTARVRFASASATGITHVIARDDRSAPVRGSRTWHFAARSVRDFAWAASPEFLWDATRTVPTAQHPDGILVNAFYKARDLPTWSSGAELARHAIEFYGARFGDYVYPQATVVSGPVYGMEYPMLVFAGPNYPFSNSMALLITHELAHQWYPMMVGSHETLYAWMDEGVATFMTSLAIEDRFGRDDIYDPRLPRWLRRLLPSGDERIMNEVRYLGAARAGVGEPILTSSNEIPRELYYPTEYDKTSAVLLMLRDVIGDSAFTRAMREYTERWRDRHPYPRDFFNTIANVSGAELDWFWNEWFVQTWTLDFAMTDVRQHRDANGWTAELVLEKLGRATMPATVRITMRDGGVRDVRVSRAVWEGTTRYDLVVTNLPAEISSVEIDPDLVLVDENRMNNRWPRPRVDVSGQLQIGIDVLPPIDRYHVSVQPHLWYTSAGGASIGATATGSYFATDDRVSGSAYENARLGTLDGSVSYSSPLRRWGVGTSWRVDGFHIEGRDGGSIALDLAPGEWHALTDGRVADTRFTVELRVIDVEDTRFLRPTDAWERGTVGAAIARLSRTMHGAWGSAFAAASLETSALTTDRSYTKASAELRGAHALGALTLNARTVGGYGAGGVPAQSQFYLAGESPWDAFSNPLFRSRGVLDALGLDSRTTLGGGGAVPSAPLDARGTKLLAANAALEYGPAELFVDAGRVWTRGEWISRDVQLDAGLGIGWDAPTHIGAIPIGDLGVHLRAPLARGVDDFRWRPMLRVVIGSRWGR